MPEKFGCRWFIGALLLLLSSACAQVGKITVVVTDDETGKPFEGVEVLAGFVTTHGFVAGPENEFECVTNSDGKCTIWGHGNGGRATVVVMNSQKYYGASETVRFDERQSPIATPWNPTIQLRLKKKRNPIPMYAMRLSDKRLPEEFRVEIFDRENGGYVEGPAETFTVAWDLEKGDWVKPHGKGEIADFIFTIHREARKKYVYAGDSLGHEYLSCGATLEISFSNDGDGLIPYPVPEKDRHRGPWLPYLAPEDGYGPIEPKININQEGREHDRMNFVKDMNYFFRVRTVKDQSGKIISALYGKIYGDFRFGGWGDYIDYTYYLNPTPNDRNVEFKPKANLFTNLKGTRDPYQP